MKQAIVISAILMASLSFSSCKEGWTDEYQQMYKEACATSGHSLELDSANRERYCDCSLEKVMKVYPNMEDAITNKDSAQMNAALQSCVQDATVR